LTKPGSHVVALFVLLAAVALVLVAQFALSSWAEDTKLNHDLQHGIIFVAGIGVGASLAALYRLGRRSAGN
jgi:ABC-type Mn2+/Zn2+ transport system permease subunit